MNTDAAKDKTVRKNPEEVSLDAKQLQESLPREVQIALDAMRRIHRTRRAVPPQRIPECRYTQIV
jgi:hypothetical protein